MPSSAARLAVVTGAGSGIGRSAAERLAATGVRSLLVGRREEPLVETAQLCEAAGASARPLPADVTDESSADALASAVDEEGGRLHLLVQCAGESLRASIDETSAEDWDRILAVNLTAPYRIIRALLPALRRAGGASVVNVASSLALGGLPRATAYCAAKGGLVQLTRALALELAPEGIRVNAVCPGLVDTPMIYDGDSEGPAAEARAREMAGIEPVGRLGRPEEIAAVIAHLCSDDSRFTTGVAWPVDGGLTAGWLE
jgi:NAD(P)-dependent dehydrogenase (short-subunit alcohol dehydrogenase family)